MFLDNEKCHPSISARGNRGSVYVTPMSREPGLLAAARVLDLEADSERDALVGEVGAR